MADYESPVKIIYGQMQTRFEDDILKAVQSYHVEVNKEELIKALRYDRGQFGKGHAVGYADGYGDACAEAKRPKWISVEDRLPEEDGTYITMTNATGKSRGVIPMEYRTSSIRGKIVRRWMWHDRISPWGGTHWMPLPEPPGGDA